MGESHQATTEEVYSTSEGEWDDKAGGDGFYASLETWARSEPLEEWKEGTDVIKLPTELHIPQHVHKRAIIITT